MVNRPIKLRLFLTCWFLFSLFFATDFVREHYLVVGLVEDHSYALDKYYGLHVDIFRNPPEAKVQGAHHGANPGISMLAAIPYLVTKPLVDLVVNRELASRRARGDTAVTYRDDRARRVAFYHNVRRMGLDVRFGLVGIITQVLLMAPLSAAGVVLMLSLLEIRGVSRRWALGLSLLFAFGTPVLFRTAYLNQNLGIGIFSLAAFALIWNPGDLSRWRVRSRYLAAGLLGGWSLLSDYSGLVPLGILGLYAWWKSSDSQRAWPALRETLWYGAGAVVPILLLWQYQWASFGHPFYPPQHWMPPVEWIEIGYQGVGLISAKLIGMLLVDPRFGLLVTMPVAVVTPFALWLAWRGKSLLPLRETVVCFGLGAAMVLFFGTVQYTQLQWVTGIRYLAAVVPFFFLAAVPVLVRMPRILTIALGFVSVVIGVSIAMVRNQGTVMDNIVRVLVEGPQLPWLTVLGKTSAQYLPWLTGRPSAAAWYLMAGVVVWLIWRMDRPWSAPQTRES
jgi:hypothetical protein